MWRVSISLAIFIGRANSAFAQPPQVILIRHAEKVRRGQRAVAEGLRARRGTGAIFSRD